MFDAHSLASGGRAIVDLFVVWCCGLDIVGRPNPGQWLAQKRFGAVRAQCARRIDGSGRRRDESGQQWSMGPFIGGPRRACAGLGAADRVLVGMESVCRLAQCLSVVDSTLQPVPWQAAGLLAAAMVLLWPVLMPVALLALAAQLRARSTGCGCTALAQDKPCASNGWGSHGSWI